MDNHGHSIGQAQEDHAISLFLHIHGMNTEVGLQAVVQECIICIVTWFKSKWLVQVVTGATPLGGVPPIIGEVASNL